VDAREASERRRWFRVDASTRVLLYRGRKLLGRGFTENFSKGGALVTIQAAPGTVPPGETVRLELALPWGEHGSPRSLHCTAEVLRTSENGSGSVIALRFRTVSMRNSSEAMRAEGKGPRREFAVVSRSANAG
jgi:hypothetical protein